MLFLFANLTGQDVTVVLKNNERFSGVFSGATTEHSDTRYVLKMVRRVNDTESTQVNGQSETGDLVGEGEDHAMSFQMQDVVSLQALEVNLESNVARAANGTTSGFRTDTEISGNLTARERELQRWQPGADSEIDLSLGADASAGLGSWDQFAANERLYNVRSDYNEDLYTTSIDRSNPRYRELEQRADRLAREMEKEGQTKKLANEADSGLDEEDKYSGVRRDTSAFGKRGPNAYVPPSQRSTSAKPASSGVPMDPAIISSQLARNDKEEKTIPVPIPVAPASAEPSKVTPNTVSENASSGPSLSVSKPADHVEAARAGAPDQSTTVTAVAPVQQKSSENYFQNVAESFKQFTSAEKLRLQQRQREVQAHRSNTARQEKSVKLNDLKKFSQNFKLHSRVPEDLVPILAKTKEKQDEIRDKAEQQAVEKEQQDKEKSTASPATKPEPHKADAASTNLAPDTSSPLGQRSRTSQGAKQHGAAPAQLSRGQGMFTQRVAQNQAQYRAGAPANLPSPLPAQGAQAPSMPGAASGESGLISPTSGLASRFNVKAMEFRPNPSASTFTPGGSSDATGSKRTSVSTPKAAAPVVSSNFFSSNKKPSKMAEADEATIAAAYNPVRRILEDKEKIKAAYKSNGNLPQAYRTPPVWDVADANQEKSYNDVFPKLQPNPAVSHMSGQPNGAMPHQHQLPLHLQNGLPNQQPPRFYSHQSQNMPHHMEDQRMQYQSSNSSVQPSPRMGHPSMVYPGQMQPQMQFPYGMPGGGMNPGMHMRPMPNGQYMGPQGAPLGGHMMMQQHSNGPYMNGPQPPSMYGSPAPHQVQPHFGGHQGQHGMPGGYGGSPRGHPMSHQGSQQGHGPQPMYAMPGQGNPMMMPQHAGQVTPMRGYAQPQFAGQGPNHAYAMQHRAMSNGGYNQMTPRQQHAMPQQGPSTGAMVPSRSSMGDDGR